jgi:hypothetical protein
MPKRDAPNERLGPSGRDRRRITLRKMQGRTYERSKAMTDRGELISLQ